MCDPPSVWSYHSKHVLVLSLSGKPVFSRHGSDGDAASLAAVVQAVSMRSAEGGDPLRSLVCADGTRIVFHSAGPLTLLALARTGEPEAALRSALSALAGYITMTLTGSVVSRLSGGGGGRSGGGDVRAALAGTRASMLHVLRCANRLPDGWLGAMPALALAPGVRTRLCSTLAAAGDAAGGGTLFALLFAGTALAGWAARRDRPLAASDAALLAAHVQSGASFRRSTGSWAPVCLPAVDASGYLQAWVALLEEVPPAPGTLAERIARRRQSAEADAAAVAALSLEAASEAAARTPLEEGALSVAAPAVPASSGSSHAYHMDRAPPGIFLVLISQGTGGEAASALASAAADAARALRTNGVMEAVTSCLARVGPVGAGDFEAARLAGGCLHLIHAWHPWRQYTQSLPPGCLRGASQRKALLRAYSHVQERLTGGAEVAAGLPPLRAGQPAEGVAGSGGSGSAAAAAALHSPRHFIASFPGLAPAAGADVAAGAPATIVTIAGLRTTNATLLAAWDASLPHAEIPQAMERLAKAIKAENERLLVANPGVLKT